MRKMLAILVAGILCTSDLAVAQTRYDLLYEPSSPLGEKDEQIPIPGYANTWLEKIQYHYQYMFRAYVDDSRPGTREAVLGNVISHYCNYSDSYDVRTGCRFMAYFHQGEGDLIKLRKQTILPLNAIVPVLAMKDYYSLYDTHYLWDHWGHLIAGGRQAEKDKLKSRNLFIQEYPYCIPDVGFRDFEDTYVTVRGKDGRTALVNGSYSIANPQAIPRRYRVWAGTRFTSRAKASPGPCIEDDVYQHNPNGVFVYTYDFNHLRQRVSGWVLHDRIYAGLKDEFIDDNGTFNWRARRKLGLSRKISDMNNTLLMANKAALEYGPMVDDPDHRILRALRLDQYCTMYYAKKRLAELCYPAPSWSEREGDYTYSASDDDVPLRAKRFGSMLYSYTYVRYPDLERARPAVIRSILDTNRYDYWAYLFTALPNPEDTVALARRYLRGEKSLLPQLRESIRRCELALIARSLRFNVATAPFNGTTFAEDYGRYFDQGSLSIAIWGGTDSTGSTRHRNMLSLKTLFPYFEGSKRKGSLYHDYGDISRDIVARMSRDEFVGRAMSDTLNTPDRRGMKAFTGAPVFKIYSETERNYGPVITGGLLYGGDLHQGETFQRMVKAHGSVKQLWANALRGPAFIVSEQCYRKYGHAWFEQKAGRPLVQVDVTGAMIDSMAKTITGATREEFSRHTMDGWTSSEGTAEKTPIPLVPSGSPEYADTVPSDLAADPWERMKRAYERYTGIHPDRDRDAFAARAVRFCYIPPYILQGRNHIKQTTYGDYLRLMELGERIRKAIREDAAQYPGLSMLRIMELFDWYGDLLKQRKGNGTGARVEPAHTLASFSKDLVYHLSDAHSTIISDAYRKTVLENEHGFGILDPSVTVSFFNPRLTRLLMEERKQLELISHMQGDLLSDTLGTTGYVASSRKDYSPATRVADYLEDEGWKGTYLRVYGEMDSDPSMSRPIFYTVPDWRLFAATREQPGKLPKRHAYIFTRGGAPSYLLDALLTRLWMDTGQDKSFSSFSGTNRGYSSGRDHHNLMNGSRSMLWRPAYGWISPYQSCHEDDQLTLDMFYSYLFPIMEAVDCTPSLVTEMLYQDPLVNFHYAQYANSHPEYPEMLTNDTYEPAIWSRVAALMEISPSPERTPVVSSSH